MKIMTDGTLYEEICANILLKEITGESLEKLNNFELEKSGHILLKNLYSTIIIDESHEHNKNMDLILSLMNITLKLNISIKLIVMSATFDFDETIFRRFYKYIDEDLSMPFYHWMYENPFKDNYYLTKNVVDRRLHISFQDDTPLFKITEIYIQNEPETYQISEDLAIDKLQKLIAE